MSTCENLCTAYRQSSCRCAYRAAHPVQRFGARGSTQRPALQHPLRRAMRRRHELARREAWPSLCCCPCRAKRWQRHKRDKGAPQPLVPTLRSSRRAPARRPGAVQSRGLYRRRDYGLRLPRGGGGGEGTGRGRTSSTTHVQFVRKTTHAHPVWRANRRPAASGLKRGDSDQTSLYDMSTIAFAAGLSIGSWSGILPCTLHTAA